MYEWSEYNGRFAPFDGCVGVSANCDEDEWTRLANSDYNDIHLCVVMHRLLLHFEYEASNTSVYHNSYSYTITILAIMLE